MMRSMMMKGCGALNRSMRVLEAQAGAVRTSGSRFLASSAARGEREYFKRSDRLRTLLTSGAILGTGLGAYACTHVHDGNDPVACFQYSNFGLRVEKKYVIIAAPGMEEFAKRLVEADPSKFQYFETSWGKFPDQTDNIYVGGFYPKNHIHDANVLFLANFSSNDTTLSQYHVMTMLCESFCDTLTILLPFYPTGTMERIVKEGTVATANTMAKMFSHLPDIGRPARLMVYDMHTLQNRFYYSDNCLADLRSAFPLLIQAIEGSDINCIAFPDEGAEKRFGAYFKKAFPDMELVTCGKHRDPNDPTVRNVVIKDGDPTGKNVIIVDDMVQSGGTLYNCGKQLLANGAKGVNAFCTHAVFPRHSWERFLKGKGDRAIFDKFYITNSNPNVVAELPEGDAFVVLDLLKQFMDDL